MPVLEIVLSIVLTTALREDRMLRGCIPECAFFRVTGLNW